MRYFSISLRVWLIGFLALSALLAWWAQQAKEQHRAVTKLQPLGASIYYSWQLDEHWEPHNHSQGVWIKWLRRQTGNDCWYAVQRVDLPPQVGTGDPTRYAPLAELSRLRKLVFFGGPITNEDLQHLRNLRALEELEIWNYGVPPFEMTPEGQAVAIHHTVNDDGLQALQYLHALEHLTLTNVAITDEGLRYLQELPRLKTLVLTNTLVTKEGKQELLEARPNLVIEE